MKRKRVEVQDQTQTSRSGPSLKGIDFLGLGSGVNHRARKLLYLSTEMDSDAWDREYGRELHRAAIEVADEQLKAKDDGRFDGRYFPMGSVSWARICTPG